MSVLYPCIYCTEDGHCKKYSNEEVTSWCVLGPCEDEKHSNADRIRSMTDEELAMWLTDFCCATVGNAAEARVAMYHCGMLEYLKQPPDSLSEIGQNTTSGCGRCDKCRINDKAREYVDNCPNMELDQDMGRHIPYCSITNEPCDLHCRRPSDGLPV